MKNKRILATVLSVCMFTGMVGMSACGDIEDPGTGA